MRIDYNTSVKKDIKMEYKKWECIVCGWIYDEEKGNPEEGIEPGTCLLYTSPSPRDRTRSRMPSSA